jgi:transcriptional regulator with XRE-family HTH domain
MARARTIEAHIAQRVRMTRKFRDMTVAQLATALKLPIDKVQDYERGAKRIRCVELLELARVLGVTPSFFFQIGDRRIHVP